MRTRLIIIGLAALAVTQPAGAQQGQAPVGVLAQAYDRCMATHAIRLTRTAAADEDIFAQATKSCGALRGELTVAIHAQIPAPQAAELIGAMEGQAKPNFLAMLARIRQDRAARPGS